MTSVLDGQVQRTLLQEQLDWKGFSFTFVTLSCLRATLATSSAFRAQKHV